MQKKRRHCRLFCARRTGSLAPQHAQITGKCCIIDDKNWAKLQAKFGPIANPSRRGLEGFYEGFAWVHSAASETNWLNALTGGFTMKKIALATALSLAATSSFAGGFAEPVTEEIVVAETTNKSSSGGIIVPLLLLLVVAAAVASN
jgi:hypothetical protein